MNVEIRRKLDINLFIIKARWFYIIGLFLLAYFAYNNDKLVSSFSILSLLAIFIFSLFVNKIFSSFANRIEKKPEVIKVNILSIVQLVVEVGIFGYITYLMGDFVFIPFLLFFFSILSASFIFGIAGSLAFSLFSGFLIIMIYFLQSLSFIPAKVDLDLFDLNAFVSKTLLVSFFYLMFSFLAGLGSQTIFSKEKELSEKSEKLDSEIELRANKMQDFDKTSSLLMDRDKELIIMNDTIDKKLKELEVAQKSQIRAFRDLKEAEKKTQLEKDKIEAIISNFVDPIMVLDPDDKIVLFNPSAENIFGLSKDSFGKKVSKKGNYSMKNIKELIKYEYSVKIAEELKIDDDSIEEIVIDNGDGEQTYKVTTSGVIGKNKENLGTMKIFYNLTREKMIDKLKSEFISIAAHQLRTPLSAIKWSIKMILDGDAGALNEEQDEILTKGYESNERIIILVNDMLNVSRIEEGRFGYSFEMSSFYEVFDQVSTNLAQRIKEADLKFSLSIPEKVPNIYMDKTKMTMVLQNLLENAVKYTQAHGKLSLILEVEEKFIKIKVKDNGVGVPKDDQEKLFSKFFRASNVVRLQTEGSGLGLFIVKNVVEKHGGKILCNSEEGVGTEFIVTLPITSEIKDNN
ncbi:MAG: ATP-binding protein [Patescibacteria group bacterium]|jgi:PAS domain S-box-containing protein|nr:ATP-binding protein [Patescibacteria group bacterium]